MPFLLFVVYPLAEIATFILVGEWVGLLGTLALVVISSALGLVTLRDAGIMTAFKLQRQAANPVAVLAEGGSRMLAGLLLLVPGFLSDFAALVVLFRPTRGLLLARIVKGAAPGRRPSSGTPPDIVEGDFRRLDR